MIRLQHPNPDVLADGNAFAATRDAPALSVRKSAVQVSVTSAALARASVTTLSVGRHRHLGELT